VTSQYVHGSQSFHLRSQCQWDSGGGGGYWLSDAKVHRYTPHGLPGHEAAASSEAPSLAVQLHRAATDAAGVGNESVSDEFMTPFTDEEHQLVEELAVVPFVLVVDEAFGDLVDGSPQANLEHKSLRLGPDVEVGSDVEGRRPWRHEGAARRTCAAGRTFMGMDPLLDIEVVRKPARAAN